MTLLSADRLASGRAIAELCYENPFTERRVELERQALGPAFVGGRALWSRSSLRFRNPNVAGLRARARELLDDAHARLASGHPPSDEERAIYAGLVRYDLFELIQEPLQHLLAVVVPARLADREPEGQSEPIAFYARFQAHAERYYGVRGLFPETLCQVPHLFATSVQAMLAFTLIFQSLLGTSRAAAELRAAVWRSIFTHDMRRYERTLYQRMHEIPTLVLGPSGTGKELVARAIGLSAYVPFNAEQQRFAAPLGGDFRALNLTALSPTLIESELFGHHRGAFTGATQDRRGFLELCTERGTIFLDEIGELHPTVQVKLLRVLQSRSFEAVGDARLRHFVGRVVSATNRDLSAQLGPTTFREDLYYRLCGHTIRTPSLAEQLAQAPDDLRPFVEHALARVLGADQADASPESSAPLVDEIVEFVDGLVGYHWPGNVRELEQCVRSYLVERDYAPRTRPRPTTPAADLSQLLASLDLSAQELVDHYCRAQYARYRNLHAVSRQLKLDWRTIKARIGPGGGQ